MSFFGNLGSFAGDALGEIGSHPWQAAGALFGVPGYDPFFGGLFNNKPGGALLSPTGNFSSSAWQDMYRDHPGNAGALNMVGGINSVLDKIAPAIAAAFVGPEVMGLAGGGAAGGAAADAAATGIGGTSATALGSGAGELGAGAMGTGAGMTGMSGMSGLFGVGGGVGAGLGGTATGIGATGGMMGGGLMAAGGAGAAGALDAAALGAQGAGSGLMGMSPGMTLPAGLSNGVAGGGPLSGLTAGTAIPAQAGSAGPLTGAFSGASYPFSMPGASALSSTPFTPNWANIGQQGIKTLQQNQQQQQQRQQQAMQPVQAPRFGNPAVRDPAISQPMPYTSFNGAPPQMSNPFGFGSAYGTL